jgi:hypothetical protein
VKTVYLIVSGGFLAFGTGCVLSVDSCFVRAFSPAGFGVMLGYFSKNEAAACAHLAIWATAIASAPDGALLRWDDERQMVVDELAPADVFAEDESTPALIPLPGMPENRFCPDCLYYIREWSWVCKCRQWAAPVKAGN